MPTITLSDYITLQDGVRRISSGFIELDASIPDDFVRGTRAAKPVIFFKFQAHRQSRIHMFVNHPNNPAAFDFTFGSTNFLRAHHEFVQGDLFTPGQTNRISFSGTGEFDVSLSDIMLLFQRSVSV